MRTVNFMEFTELPTGTVFSYAPCETALGAEGLYIRGATIKNDDGVVIDYFQYPLLPSTGDCREEDWTRLRYDTCPGRWAMFDFNQLYHVYEKADIVKLRIDLRRALGGRLPEC